MKLGLVLCLAIILVISINIVSAQAQSYGLPPSEQASHSATLQQALEQARTSSQNGLGICDPNYTRMINPVDPAKQELEKQICAQQAQIEKNTQILLMLAIGIPVLVIAVIISLLAKNRKSHDS